MIKDPWEKKGETQALKRMHENCFHISGDNGFLMWIYKTLKLLTLCCCCVRGIHNLAKKQFTLMVQNPKRIRRRKKCTTPLEIALFRRSQRTEMAKGHPKIRARYAIRGAGFAICDMGGRTSSAQPPASRHGDASASLFIVMGVVPAPQDEGPVPIRLFGSCAPCQGYTRS